MAVAFALGVVVVGIVSVTSSGISSGVSVGLTVVSVTSTGMSSGVSVVLTVVGSASGGFLVVGFRPSV